MSKLVRLSADQTAFIIESLLSDLKSMEDSGFSGEAFRWNCVLCITDMKPKPHDLAEIASTVLRGKPSGFVDLLREFTSPEYVAKFEAAYAECLASAAQRTVSGNVIDFASARSRLRPVA